MLVMFVTTTVRRVFPLLDWMCLCVKLHLLGVVVLRVMSDGLSV